MHSRTPLAQTRPTGFTLIELLTVIAVIGVLAAIIMSTLGRARSAARRTECLSNLRQTSLAILLFANDHKGAAPALFVSSSQGGLGVWSKQLVDSGVLSAPPKLFTCPDDTRARAINDSAAAAGSDYERRNAGRSQAYAYPAMQPVLGSENRNIPRRLNSVGAPSQALMLVEFHAGQDYRQVAGAHAGSDVLASGPTHGATRAYAFMDGHVAALTTNQANQASYWNPK